MLGVLALIPHKHNQQVRLHPKETKKIKTVAHSSSTGLRRVWRTGEGQTQASLTARGSHVLSIKPHKLQGKPVAKTGEQTSQGGSLPCHSHAVPLTPTGSSNSQHMTCYKALALPYDLHASTKPYSGMETET